MLTPDQFRALALGMEGAVEGAHMGHPDFRANGRIFATLYPDGERGMVKLGIEEQQIFVDAHPAMFAPASGAWGLQGCTTVRLETADRATLLAAMELAWQCALAKRPSNRSKTKPKSKANAKAKATMSARTATKAAARRG